RGLAETWQIGTVRSVSWQIAFISPRMHVQRQSAEAGAGSASRAAASRNRRRGVGRLGRLEGLPAAGQRDETRSCRTWSRRDLADRHREVGLLADRLHLAPDARAAAER
ncbi:hypothetical protein CTI14_57050, partial [Methylobacterium radiotolerans]